MTQWVNSSGFPPLSGGIAGERAKLPECGEVFCDWLDVTFSPAEDLSWLQPFLSSAGAVSLESGKYSFPEGGVIKHQTGRRWQRLSFSGVSLAVIRGYSLFNELLRLISQHPYKITRIDAALDLGVDAAPLVTGLWDRYKSSPVKLNIWNSLTSQSYFGARFDDVITGTFYAGNRRVNKITARVYDKQHEVYQRKKVDIGSRIRYELTVKTDSVTLRDVDSPSLLFWHYMSPELITAPPSIAAWVPGNPYVWSCSKLAAVSVEDRLQRVIYGTGDLNAAMAICGDSVAMFDYLSKLVSLRISDRASRLPGWSPSYVQ